MGGCDDGRYGIRGSAVPSQFPEAAAPPFVRFTAFTRNSV